MSFAYTHAPHIPVKNNPRMWAPIRQATCTWLRAQVWQQNTVLLVLADTDLLCDLRHRFLSVPHFPHL